MEILVVTLAYTTAARDTQTQIHVRQAVEALRNAPGLASTRIYHGRDHDPCYLILTTWSDEESWQKAQEKQDPSKLLLIAPDLLIMPPEQWVMKYLWGYTRPAASSTMSEAHLTIVRPQHSRFARNTWIQGLRQHIIQPQIAFAFLACEIQQDATPHDLEEITTPRQAIKAASKLEAEDLELKAQDGSVLLSFLNWANEGEREEFYAAPHYQAIKQQIERIGTMRIVALSAVASDSVVPSGGSGG